MFKFRSYDVIELKVLAILSSGFLHSAVFDLTEMIKLSMRGVCVNCTYLHVGDGDVDTILYN